MPSIYLGKQSSSYSIGKVSVNEEPYETSNLFLKFKHTPPSNDNSGNIYLFRTSWSLLYYSANSASLQLRNEYYNSRLKHAEVYINRFDSTNTPLICVFKFDKGQDRIYINSEHGYLIDRNISTNITSLSRFTQPDQKKELLELLIKESDLHLNSVTYELDKTNNNNQPKSYNSNKITLSTKQNVVGFSLDQIYKYTHTRIDRRFKKSFLLLNNKTPMASIDRPVRDIQGDEYDSINVYYNTKENIPIMIELVTKREKRHLHRISTDGLLWLRNDISNSRDALIKYLNYTTKYVEDKKVEEQQKRDRERSRGRGTVRGRERTQQHDRGQERERGQDGEQGTRTTGEQGPEPTQTLPEATSPSLRPEGAASPPKRSEPSLNPKICVLINKQQQYQKSDVETISETSNPKFKISDKQPETISVGFSDLNNSEYKIYTHEIKSKESQDVTIELSIYISNIGIFLYGSSGNIQDNLIFKSGQHGDKLQVYFYKDNSKTSKSDTVPLMIQYNGQFYGPSKLVNYFTAWNRLVGITGTSQVLSKVKEKLDTINKELNRIELSNTGGDKCSYGLQTFTGVQINNFPTERVKVTIQSKNNYTRVIHRTINSFTIGDIYYGTDDISKGKITIKGTGGRIESNTIRVDTSKNHKEFVKNSKPNTVVAYYSKDDRTYKLPQLIVLMETAGPIEQGSDTLITSSSNKYGYYVLATENGVNYKYEWRQPDEQPPKEFKLDPETEYSLLNSLVILMAKQSQYDDSVIKVALDSIPTVRSPGNQTDVNRLKGKSITVNGLPSTDTTAKCVSKYGYVVKIHELTKATEQIFSIKPILGLRFLVPSRDSQDKYQEITLNPTDSRVRGIVELLYHTNSNNKIYVWFYDKDPRPLLLCYGGTAYAPKTIETYFTQWTKVDVGSGSAGFKECGCPSSGVHTHEDLNKLLQELDRVVKFLNQVNLKEGTRNGSGSGQTHKYKVHTFQNKKIQIKVECSPVGDSGPPLPPPGTCSALPSNTSFYKMFKHAPAGMTNNGANGSGFRLGAIEYIPNGGDGKTTSTLNTDKSQYKYNPLVGVSVFYYEHDKGYSDPLLIELEFKNNGAGGGAGPKEYYKLTQLGSTDGNGMKWQKDENAQTQMISKPVAYLDSIRHSLKPVIKIYIEQQSPYELCLSKNLGGEGDVYQPENQKKIHVSECSEPGCSNLKSAGYICYEHQISKLNGGSFDYNDIGGLKFFISGKNGEAGGDKDIEIKLYNENGESSNRQLQQITYNLCMKNIYVFFYWNNNSKQVDTVPLMLTYNGMFYEPENRDNYFSKWKHVNNLQSTTKPCGGDNEYKTLTSKLDIIYNELNRIDLDCEKINKKSYGLPEKSELKGIFNTERVKVTIQNGPTKQTNIYIRVTHRTFNGFRIGDIHYGGKEIVANGVNVNNASGQVTKIETRSGRHNHKPFIKNKNPNTVVSYYSISDKGYKLPQVILLMTTENSIEQGDKHITAKLNTEYGYYSLSTDRDDGVYKYKWRRPTETQSQQLTLNEETEFLILNSIIILVDKQSTYQESDIHSAVKSATTVRSLGKFNDVNRLKDKTINVTDDSKTAGGATVQCISKYGYRLYAHDISGLVTWTGSTGHPAIPLISGLRFLVPSSENATGYQEINLYKDDTAKEPAERLFHSPTDTPNTSSQNKVYIFFYGLDPRPLLLCYGDSAYKPKKPTDPIPERQVIMEYSEWTRVTNITECTCMGSGLSQNDDNILNALLEVVCFLNPVQINPKQIPGSAKTQITKEPPKVPLPTSVEYNLHEYKYNSHVKMKITRTSVSCYEQYKYEPGGTNGTVGTGFRLGTVFYTGTHGGKPKGTLDYSKVKTFHKYNPLLKATVYYYRHDNQYEEPLLIEFEFQVPWSVETSKEKDYWKLTKREISTVTWNKDSAAKEKLSDDSDNKKLVEYLDTIRYNFKNVLQVCIAIKKNESYPANLFDWNSGNPVEPKEEIQVTVTEETNCGSLTETGFRCFKHKITELGSTTLHKIGGLEFFTPNESGRLVPMNLYELPTSRPIKPLYYNCGMGDIYVYFYGKGNGSNVDGDPRPLLLCYNNKGYKAFNMTTYDSQIWLKSTEMNDCLNITGDNILLKELVKVCNFLNPVYINKAVTGVYRVHTFNGQHIYNSLKETKSSGNFCYHKYVHSPNGFENKVKNSEGGKGFRLGKIEYGSNCIREEGSLSVCITSLLDDPPQKYIPASEVVVYYYKRDTTLKNPLLVALCKKDNGCTLNAVGSTTITCTCQPYYELQRSSIMTTKMYKKSDNTITLEERPGTELEKILDKILYYVSNSILINLSFRTRTEVKYPGEIGKQNIIIEHNIYSARVYDNFENKSQSGKTEKTIDVNVCGPFDITNPAGKKTGYQCYRHELSNIKEYEQIGGLRLFLWDNRDTGKREEDKEDCKVTEPTNDNKKQCCEITLWESCNQDSKTQAQEINPIAYTTCKGDLYVYFYGSDPRPLLLCYNGQAYKPIDLNTYIT